MFQALGNTLPEGFWLYLEPQTHLNPFPHVGALTDFQTRLVKCSEQYNIPSTRSPSEHCMI